MRIKSLWKPFVSQHYLSRARLQRLRLRAERTRVAGGKRHEVHYFHQVDDPYSALLAAALPRLAERYDLEVVPHVVGPPRRDAAPEPERLIAYSRQDAQLLARHWNLDFRDPGRQPSPAAVDSVTRLLVGACAAGTFLEVAADLSARLWRGETLPAAGPTDVTAHLDAASALRQKLGHYLGATLFYGGEWYWGLDRLYHLERRLQELGAPCAGVDYLLFPPDRDLTEPVPIANPPPIEFCFSLRSPYSAIVAPRIFELGRLTGAPVRLRYVLPMAMRGLPVPVAKSLYISLDAAREAHARGIPFGRVSDPLGRPAERGLALIPFAERAGRGQAYVLSFLQGVWAEGINAGSDRGLRQLVERSGLAWSDACLALKDEAWRATAEHNRQELFGMGLWGVPSFQVGNAAVWGQDRLWAVRDALLKTPGVEAA